MGKVVTAHPVFGLDVTNGRLDSRSPSHLALDRRRDTALLAGGEDPEPMAFGCVVSAVSGIGQDAADLVADGFLHVWNDGC